jgi:poly-gamma-glutamate capsule biosynthesis protein CapA/YwtB (metallophosphatase superfamily)
LTDNEPEWEATDERPGVHFVSYGERGLDEPYRTRLAEAIRHAQREASFVLVSAHVGPNWGSPSRSMRALAHDLLDLGADLYWGHSNHTPQGIELRHGKAILYSTGDFIDDYAVDLHERNDLSFLFVLEMDMPRVRSIRLHPVAIEHCRVRLAKDTEAAFLEQRIRSQCAVFGTPLSFHDGLGLVTMG